MTSKHSPSDVDRASRDHVPGVNHAIEKPAGGQKQEDIEDRPNVSTTTPDKYPGHR